VCGVSSGESKDSEFGFFRLLSYSYSFRRRASNVVCSTTYVYREKDKSMTLHPDLVEPSSYLKRVTETKKVRLDVVVVGGKVVVVWR
jgi:hypothetical protein